MERLTILFSNTFLFLIINNYYINIFKYFQVIQIQKNPVKILKVTKLGLLLINP